MLYLYPVSPLLQGLILQKYSETEYLVSSEFWVQICFTKRDSTQKGSEPKYRQFSLLLI